MNQYIHFPSSWEEAKIKYQQNGLVIGVEEKLPLLEPKKAVFLNPRPGEAWAWRGAQWPPLFTVQIPGGMQALYQILR